MIKSNELVAVSAWRRTRDSGYLGVLSVDIGDMHTIDTSLARVPATLAFDRMKKAVRAAEAAKQDSAPEEQVEIALATSQAAKQASESIDMVVRSGKVRIPPGSSKAQKCRGVTEILA